MEPFETVSQAEAARGIERRKKREAADSTWRDVFGVVGAALIGYGVWTVAGPGWACIVLGLLIVAGCLWGARSK